MDASSLSFINILRARDGGLVGVVLRMHLIYVPWFNRQSPFSGQDWIYYLKE
jgi:hypothetical protein